MKNKRLILLLILIIGSKLIIAQATCNGLLPFEEQNGILTIEMESGILPSGSDWKMGSEADPNLAGSTINYIFWDGTESFGQLSGAAITYNIKINNPGTYRLAWRGRIGKGTSRGEHNDAWLKIVADDFFATKSSSPTSTEALAEALEPKPSCSSNPDRDCPEGSTSGGFFKAFMNRDPTGDELKRWGFVTNTNDGNSFRFIWATFNTAGNYSIIVDARSSFFFMDKIVLRRSNVSDSNAFNLNNPESSCYDALSIESQEINEIKIFPNPTKDKVELTNLPLNSNLIIYNVYGSVIKEITTNKSTQIIDMTRFKSGLYFIASRNGDFRFIKKIIKH
ncbi:T9SS type A sorting domain-containing protein [Bacteroidota bacterium]